MRIAGEGRLRSRNEQLFDDVVGHGQRGGASKAGMRVLDRWHSEGYKEISG
jgi:hypothetical protein